MLVIVVSFSAYAWATRDDGEPAKDGSLHVSTHLSSDTITWGDNLIVFASVEDDAEKPIEKATVTATIGDLEILFLFTDQGTGEYYGTIDTSIVKHGAYTIVVTAQKEEYEPHQSSVMVMVTSDVIPPSDPNITTFKVIVNGMRSVDVLVDINLTDGLTQKEAALIAEAMFIQVIGDDVTHQLDALTFNDVQIQAHYAWGLDEKDVGHVFDMTADLTSLQITVSHCF